MNKKKLYSIIASASAAVSLALSNAMSAFADDAATAASSAQNQAQMSSTAQLMSMAIPTALLFGLLYFVAIKPQKKRDQELKEMQANIQIGDEIVTGGGIVGIVASIGDDTIVIETGPAKHKLRIKNWAITENVTATERAKEAKAKSAPKKSLVDTAAVVDEAKKKTKKTNKE